MKSALFLLVVLSTNIANASQCHSLFRYAHYTKPKSHDSGWAAVKVKLAQYQKLKNTAEKTKFLSAMAKTASGVYKEDSNSAAEVLLDFINLEINRGATSIQSFLPHLFTPEAHPFQNLELNIQKLNFMKLAYTSWHNDLFVVDHSVGIEAINQLMNQRLNIVEITKAGKEITYDGMKPTTDRVEFIMHDLGHADSINRELSFSVLPDYNQSMKNLGSVEQDMYRIMYFQHLHEEELLHSATMTLERAKEIKSKNPKMTNQEALKEAWQHPVSAYSYISSIQFKSNDTPDFTFNHLPPEIVVPRGHAFADFEAFSESPMFEKYLYSIDYLAYRYHDKNDMYYSLPKELIQEAKMPDGELDTKVLNPYMEASLELFYQVQWRHQLKILDQSNN